MYSVHWCLTWAVKFIVKNIAQVFANYLLIQQDLQKKYAEQDFLGITYSFD